MPNPTLIGYGEEGYLDNPYMGGTALYATGMQVNLMVVDALKPTAMQVERHIVDYLTSIGVQVTLTVETDDSTGMQVNRLTGVETSFGMQVNLSVEDFNKYIGSQVNLTVTGQKELGVQALQNIVDYAKAFGFQVNRQVVDFNRATGMEVRRDKTFPHVNCNEAGYLEQDYLTQEYMGNYFCVYGPMQVNLVVADETVTGAQVELNVVDHLKNLAFQVELNIVDHPQATGAQVDRGRVVAMGAQVLRVLYNTYNLRILCDFPSRGTTGTNWTSTSTASGDFSVNNLNTDIVEQTWRSNGATSVVLTCDTQITQGTLVDTMAMLNHNLTTSATISFEGSNDNFTSVGITIPVEATEDNIYYIAPTFPTTQYRYWRLIINDVTNPYGYLQIGTIVFGTTVILQGESFVDELTRKTIHFSDKVRTEGFTNVSNDRALKYATSMEFRNIQYGRGNFKNLKDIFKTARTSLKCLWIPDPRDPPRFAVFGKLTQIPEEQHKNMGADASDNVDFRVEVDESL
jgi:hypothetical protein